MLNVITVGAGFFAGFHVEAWGRNPDTSLRALVDLDGDKARSLATENAPEENAEIFTDPTKAFAAIKADIIDIAAPPTTHLELVRRALETDAQVIICQKPFCASFEQAEEAIALAASAKKRLIIHENFRFQPWFRTIRHELEAGRLGEVYQLSFRLRPGDGQGPDAYLARQPYFQQMERFLIHETAIHFIDVFRFLLGEPTRVMADLRRLNPVIKGEDAGFFVLKYEDGRRAVFDGNRLADHATDNTRRTMGEGLVEGSDGVLELDGRGSVWFRAKGSEDRTELSSDQDTPNFGGDCVYAFQKHVSDHLLNGTSLENTAAEYLRNMIIGEAIYRSASEERTIII